MKVINVPIDLIRVEARMREVDYEHVTALAETIAKVGLIHPITVYEGKVGIANNFAIDGYRVVAGVHRFHACRQLGMAEIPVSVVDLPDLERNLIEIDENLLGPTLTKQDLYILTHRRKVIYEALYPETKNGGSPGKAGGGKVAKMSKTRSFADDLAAKSGVHRTTVCRNARRGAVLDNEAMKVLRGSGLDEGRNLDAVTRLPVAEQHHIAKLVEQGAIDDARSMIAGELYQMKKLRSSTRALAIAWNRTPKEARMMWCETYRGELERLLGVPPDQRTKPKLKIVDNQTADEIGDDERTA